MDLSATLNVVSNRGFSYRERFANCFIALVDVVALETKSKPKHPIMTWGVNRLHHRCWSALERHWNGTQLHTLDTAVRWAKSMTWNALSPIVGVATKLYANGVKLTKKAFAKLASRLQRTAGVEWWSVRIVPHPCIQ